MKHPITLPKESLLNKVFRVPKCPSVQVGEYPMCSSALREPSECSKKL